MEMKVFSPPIIENIEETQNSYPSMPEETFVSVVDNNTILQEKLAQMQEMLEMPSPPSARIPVE